MGDLLPLLTRYVEGRIKQHEDNLALWQSGALTPTEPSEEERNAVMRELKAAIYELKQIQSVLV